MQETCFPHFTIQEATEKLGRRVRAIADIPASEMKQGAIGTVTGVLHYYDRTADLLVTWDDPTVIVLGYPLKPQNFFDCDLYGRYVEELDGR